MPTEIDDPPDRLIGRRSERAELRELAADVRGGASRVLVVHGDAGIGKTALLDDLAAAQHGASVARLIGAEAEANLPFAGIQRLITGRLSADIDIPEPQRDALAIAIGLESGPPPDRLLVGLSVLSLLTEIARSAPILVLVDDAHWLDQESIDALALVGRRLHREGVGLILGRRTEQPIPAFGGFPDLQVSGLAQPDALTLLDRIVTRPLQERISSRIITATAGNPLALIDLAQEMSTHQLVGLTLLPEPLPIGSHLEAHYLRQTQALGTDVQTWLLLAAAEPTGDPAYVAGAAAVLGIDVDAADLAEAVRLVRVGSRIEFRHPLVRSAIYRGATAGQRRRVHNALGAVTRRKRDVDRRAWHLAAGCIGPDETVAVLLEQAAERARERGGYSARASFLARSAELTPDGDRRTARSLNAAEAALMAGRATQSRAILDEMELRELDDVARGRYLMIHGTVEAFSGGIGAMAGVPAICVAAADAFSTSAPERARDALLIAFDRANSAEWMTTGTTLGEIAQRAIGLNRGEETSLPDRVLTAMAALVRRPFTEAVPIIRLAVDALRSPDAADDDLVRFGSLGVILTTATWDDQARNDILTRVATVARRTGAVHTLDMILFILSVSETVLGQLASAEALLAELKRLRDDLGMTPAQQEMFKNIEYLAWRGDDGALLGDIEASSQAALALGMGAAHTLARTALMILDICHCDYEAAYHIAQHNHDLRHMQISIRVLPDLVETAVRSGRIEQARVAVAELDTVAIASGTHWGLGVLERSRALLAEDTDPEQHYAAAIEHLSACRAQGDLARTHLLYGEWLRRRKRRTESRTQLRAALEQFQQMGAASFADRARRELGIIGGDGEHQEEFPWRPAGLTPQESAVADLAVGGATNGEIAAALMISRHTVDYHLRKVFRKLGISSRRQLAGLRRTTSTRP